MQPNNNLGQENTEVRRSAAGRTVAFEALLINRAAERRRLSVLADRYSIPDGKVTLKLRRREFALRPRRPFPQLHGAMLSIDPLSNVLRAGGPRVPVVTRYAYAGFGALHNDNRRGSSPIEPPWIVRVDGQQLERGRVEIELEAGEKHSVHLEVQVPSDARRGQRVPFNFTALDSLARVLGGVTVEIEVV